MARSELGAKGRLVIPAQARAEADIEIGQPVSVRADGVGRIVIETLDSVQAQVWAGAPGGENADDSRRDVRSLREDDARAADDAAARRARPRIAVEPQEPDEAGAALLAALDL